MKRRSFLKILGMVAVSMCVSPVKTLKTFSKHGVKETLRVERNRAAKRLAIAMNRTRGHMAAGVFNNAFTTKENKS